MRRLLLIMCSGLLYFSPLVHAGVAQFAFRISFTNKVGAPALSATPSWLSQRSLDRRFKFHINLDSTDRPVSPVYIDSVLFLSQGVFHVSSRWLNDCVILVTDTSTINQLRSRSWIRDVSWVGYFSGGLHAKPAGLIHPKSTLELSIPRTAKSTGSSAFYGNTFGQTTFVNGDYLHDLGFLGTGKLIAVLDEGFEYTDANPAFDSLFQSGRLLETYNFVHPGTSIYVGSSHGTSSLSTIAGYQPGTFVGCAPQAQYALYLTEDITVTDALYELDNLIAGMERADSIGADIITCSLAYNIFVSPYNYSFLPSDLDGFSTNVSRAANMAVTKGIFYTTSAGNEGGNSWNYLDAPGDADSVLTIGSVTNLRLPSVFSSPGPNASGRVKPDLCLLGNPVEVINFSTGVSSSSGTSFSTPQAAGYAACLLQAFPASTPYRIRQAMITSADHFSNPTAQIGYGIPDFKKVYHTLGVPRSPTRSEIQILPNPCQESFWVALPISATQVHFVLYDIAGRSISIQINNQGNLVSIRLPDDLPNGCYFLHTLLPGQSVVNKLMHY